MSTSAASSTSPMWCRSSSNRCCSTNRSGRATAQAKNFPPTHSRPSKERPAIGCDQQALFRIDFDNPAADSALQSSFYTRFLECRESIVSWGEADGASTNSLRFERANAGTASLTRCRSRDGTTRFPLDARRDGGLRVRPYEDRKK
jgi:hypothetical protein